MEFRSIFRHPPGGTIPLLPLHNLPTHAPLDFPPSLSPPKSQYQTAPQSPDLEPIAYPFQRVSLTDPSPPTMSSLTPRPPIPQSDTQIALHRQQTHLESHLQVLLDAQSEGLLAGLAGGAPPSAQDDRSPSTAGRSASRSTTGTATPTSTTRSSRIPWAPPGSSRDLDNPPDKPIIIPIRQPKPKRIGLRSARREISRTISSLALLKTQETSALETQISQREAILVSANKIADKEAGLRSQIRQIEDEAGGEQSLKSMQREAQELDTEILAAEARLSEMKARQRVLRLGIREVESRVQARLSSYRNALALAEKEGRAFVARPPLDGVERGRGGGGVWDLPKERRTLELVRDFYSEEGEALRAEIEGLEREREALDEGGEVWSEVVAEVGAVEEALRMEMKGMSSTAEEEETEGGRISGMRRLLGRMGQAVERVEGKLKVAEERGWNLLVVAVGAEVEALREGWRVLEGTVRVVAGEGEELLDVDAGDDGRVRGERGEDESGGESEKLGNGEGVSSANGPPPLLDGFDENDNDGPGPDLLIEEREDD